MTLQAKGVGVSTSPYVTTLKWKVVTLPEGMTLSPAGVLSGTPNRHLAPGPSSVKVKVTETVTTVNGANTVMTKARTRATIPLTIN